MIDQAQNEIGQKERKKHEKYNIDDSRCRACKWNHNQGEHKLYQQNTIKSTLVQDLYIYDIQ